MEVALTCIVMFFVENVCQLIAPVPTDWFKLMNLRYLLKITAKGSKCAKNSRRATKHKLSKKPASGNEVEPAKLMPVRFGAQMQHVKNCFVSVRGITHWFGFLLGNCGKF